MKTEKYEVIREYFDDGKLSYEEYKFEGKRHNTTGPAFRNWNENGQLVREIYYLNGQRHNSNGIAYRCWNKDGSLQFEQHWLNGVYVTKELFENRNDCVANKVVEIEGKKYKLIAV